MERMQTPSCGWTSTLLWDRITIPSVTPLDTTIVHIVMAGLSTEHVERMV